MLKGGSVIPTGRVRGRNHGVVRRIFLLPIFQWIPVLADMLAVSTPILLLQFVVTLLRKQVPSYFWQPRRRLRRSASLSCAL